LSRSTEKEKGIGRKKKRVAGPTAPWKKEKKGGGKTASEDVHHFYRLKKAEGERRGTNSPTLPLPPYSARKQVLLTSCTGRKEEKKGVTGEKE